MRFEGEDTAWEVSSGSETSHFGNQGLVSQVNSVEIADSEAAVPEAFRWSAAEEDLVGHPKEPPGVDPRRPECPASD